MRTRRITLFVLAITATLLWTTTTQALTLNMVTIGDPGNPDFDGQGGGSIAATYEIGATEVTVADWVEFLNAADPDADNDKGLWGGAMQNNMHGGVSKRTSPQRREVASKSRQEKATIPSISSTCTMSWFCQLDAQRSGQQRHGRRFLHTVRWQDSHQPYRRDSHHT